MARPGSFGGLEVHPISWVRKVSFLYLSTSPRIKYVLSFLLYMVHEGAIHVPVTMTMMESNES